MTQSGWRGGVISAMYRSWQPLVMTSTPSGESASSEATSESAWCQSGWCESAWFDSAWCESASCQATSQIHRKAYATRFWGAEICDFFFNARWAVNLTMAVSQGIRYGTRWVKFNAWFEVPYHAQLIKDYENSAGCWPNFLLEGSHTAFTMVINRHNYFNTLSDLGYRFSRKRFADVN